MTSWRFNRQKNFWFDLPLGKKKVHSLDSTQKISNRSLDRWMAIDRRLFISLIYTAFIMLLRSWSRVTLPKAKRRKEIASAQPVWTLKCFLWFHFFPFYFFSILCVQCLVCFVVFQTPFIFLYLSLPTHRFFHLITCGLYLIILTFIVYVKRHVLSIIDR